MRYYLTDLDGTLLRPDATLSDNAARALQEAVRAGARIGYATARSHRSSWPIVAAVPWNTPLVLYNGALLYDPQAGAVIDGRWLGPEPANRIIECGRRFGVVPLAFVMDGGGRERVLHEPLARRGDIAFRAGRPNDPRFLEVERLRIAPDARTMALTYIGTLGELEPFYDWASRALGDCAHIHMMADSYIEHHYFLEFSHPLANKGEGLLLWCEHVGCRPSEVTVFGDQLNDIGMFERAGRRVAAAGAHERILALADRVAGSNRADGVAEYIRRDMAGGSGGSF